MACRYLSFCIFHHIYLWLQRATGPAASGVSMHIYLFVNTDMHIFYHFTFSPLLLKFNEFSKKYAVILFIFFIYSIGILIFRRVE